MTRTIRLLAVAFCGLFWFGVMIGGSAFVMAATGHR